MSSILNLLNFISIIHIHLHHSFHNCGQRSLVSCRCGFWRAFMSDRTELRNENPAYDAARIPQCNLQFVVFSCFILLCLPCDWAAILFGKFWISGRLVRLAKVYDCELATTSQELRIFFLVQTQPTYIGQLFFSLKNF